MNFTTPDFSTPYLGLESIGLRSLGLKSSRLKSLGLKSPGFESSWLKSLGLKGLRLKLGVQKSGVEMSFNRINVLSPQSATTPRRLTLSLITLYDKNKISSIHCCMKCHQILREKTLSQKSNVIYLRIQWKVSAKGFTLNFHKFCHKQRAFFSSK